MNIFYVHRNPVVAAQMMCDKHVVKMVIETAQMLCTAHTFSKIRARKMGLYLPAHVMHPSTKWVRSSREHYEWTYAHFVALCDEYTHRYDKVHMTDKKLREKLKGVPEHIVGAGFCDPPQCMFEDVKCADTVEAYRNYYRVYKKNFARWTRRNVPDWFTATDQKEE